MAEAPAFGEQVSSLLEATYADLTCTFADVGTVFQEVGTPERIADLVAVLRSAAGARDALDAALVVPGQDGADGPYLGGSFGIVFDEPLPPYATRPTLPEPPALAACAAAGAPTVADPGGAGSAGPDGASGGRPERGVDVPARVRPGAPDLPASTGADADGGGFPLATLLAVGGLALLIALLVAVRPWRWLPTSGGPDSDDA